MRFKTVLLFGCLVLLAGCGPLPDPNSFVGRTAPDFEVETFQSKAAKQTLSAFKGKPVILDFWATWCGPCKQLTPHVETVYEEFKSQGLEGMAITDQDRETVAKFESVTPHKLPVYIDQSELAGGAFRANALPRVIIIDRKGKIIYDQTGYAPGTLYDTEKAMRQAVKSAIASA